MTNRPILKLSMPKWGLTMTQGRVVKWLAQEGARIAAGSEVVDVETEKIASAVEAPVDGVLRRRIAKEGEVVPVAGLLGVIADPDVPDAEIDSFIEAFRATFVPEEAQADGPAFERVEIAGRSLRYLKCGQSGEPVLLLHGFGGDLNDWRFNHEALAASREVYALELPGHGESSKAVGDGTVGSLAETVSAFMDAVGLPTAHLVGHSLGGAVALYLGSTRPDRVSSIILICSAGLGPEIDGDFVDGFIGARRRKEVEPHLQKLFADPSLVNRQLVDHVLKFKRLDGVDLALRTIAGEFIADGKQTVILRDRLDEVSTPVLLIWGARDQIIPASQAEGIPGPVRVEIIQDSGHMVHMEAASEVNRLIDVFLG
jgi:pyruvate dehydrogenase E2 component (dihydrolipoamide acetyltransferase)